MIFFVYRAEPLKVELDGVIDVCWHISEGRAGVYKRSLNLISFNQMIVHHNTSQRYLEVSIRIQHLHPFQFLFLLGVANVLPLVVASHLHIAAILAKAHRELTLLNDFCFIHHVINRFESIQVHLWLFLAQPQYSVGLLTIEILGLGVDTAEGILELIFSNPEVLSKVELILDDVAFVARAFSIALVKATFIAIFTLAVNFFTVISLESSRLLGIV